MKYKIVTITKDRKRYENTITNNEYIDLRKSIEILKIYIDVFLLNYNIKKTCEDYNVTCKKSNNDTSHFAEINRLVLTLLSSFYMYIEFNEKKNNILWESICSKYYDNCFCYRFFYNLRRHMQHNGISIKGYEIKYINGEFSGDYYVSNNELLESSAVQASFKKELNKISLEKIFLKKYIFELSNMIDDLTLELLHLQQQVVLENFNKIIKHIPCFDTNMILNFIEENNNNTQSSPAKILNMFVETMSFCFIYKMEDYKKQRLIYDSNSFFRLICRAYFKQDEVIPNEVNVKYEKA